MRKTGECVPLTAATQSLLQPEEEQLPRFRGEQSWLTDYRKAALAVYAASRPEPNPLYKKYVNLSKFEDSGFRIAPVAETLDRIPAEFAGLRDDSIFSVQSSAGLYSEWKSLPDGVIIEELGTASSLHGEKMKELFGSKGLRPSDDMYVALNNAMMTGGTYIHVPRNTTLKKPIHTVFVDDAPGSAHFHQNIVHLEEGASVEILSEVLSRENGSQPTLFSEVTDIFAGDGSSVSYASLENLSQKSVYISNRRSLSGKESNVRWVSSYIGSDLTRARADTKFTGRGATTEDYEILFGNGSQRFDVVTDLHHEVPDTSGRITVRSVLREKSRSLLRGMIRIGEGGANTSSYLAEHGMLLSKDAKCDAIPGLEILTNGVKATHSASVSQMDEGQLYYLETRGLSRDEAEKLMVMGFFDPVISRIPTEAVRDKMRFLIEDKWNNVISLESNRHLDELEFEKYVKDQIKTTENIFEGHYKYR